MSGASVRLALFIVGVLGAGFAIGFLNLPGAWYAQLNKPPFNPPNAVFAPAWSVIYLLVAIAGWRTFERDRTGIAMSMWWTQLVLNFCWSPVFFSFHWTSVALAVIVTLLGLIVAFIVRQWFADRTAALLFVPYAAWVAFASLLNFEIIRLN